MGREQRRKEEKRNKNRKKIEENEEALDTSIKGTTILKVVSAIILIIITVYYIMAVFITKEIDVSGKNSDSETSNTSTNSSITNKIVAQNIFNQKEEVYYVYCYDFNNEDEGVAQAINEASNKTIYRLNTKDGFNSKYVTSDTGNKNATSLDDLKVSDPTLLEITGDKITGYYEGRNSIMTFLS